jgi:predicted amidophosphoribosyltransferase
VLFPVSCPVCGAEGAAPCPSCAARLRPAPALRCPPSLDECAAVLAYEGVGRELVARLKYRTNRAALGAVAAAMAALVDVERCDVVTWIPTSGARRRARGFDHAELLARAVARDVGRQCTRLLRRRAGPPQTGRSLAQRRRGPQFDVPRPPPPRVLVVDDVVTSGATLSSAATVLRAAGAREVRAVVAARTPPKVRH